MTLFAQIVLFLFGVLLIAVEFKFFLNIFLKAAGFILYVLFSLALVFGVCRLVEYVILNIL